jgi:hypothetical protein
MFRVSNMTVRIILIIEFFTSILPLGYTNPPIRYIGHWPQITGTHFLYKHPTPHTPQNSHMLYAPSITHISQAAKTQLSKHRSINPQLHCNIDELNGAFVTQVSGERLWTNSNKASPDLMLLIPCLFLQLKHQQNYALNKIQCKTSIKLLHVSAPECHLQGLF